MMSDVCIDKTRVGKDSRHELERETQLDACRLICTVPSLSHSLSHFRNNSTDGKVASQCLQNKRSLTVVAVVAAVVIIITPEEVRSSSTPTPPRVRLHSGTRKMDAG